MTRRISAEPFSPGEYIKDAMDALGWTQDTLAEVLGRSRQHVNRLLQGKTAVTAETAHELGQAFGTSAEVWWNLQKSYELALAAKEDREIAKRHAIYSKYPIAALRKRCWIPQELKAVDELEQSLCRFLQVRGIDEMPSIAVAARKTGDYSVPTTGGQAAWFCRARELALSIPAAPFCQIEFINKLPTLRQLAAYPQDARRVPKVLAEMGVRLLLLEPLPSTKIDGVAMWVDEQPIVVLALRYDRLDNFWFTLMHELMHIKHRDETRIDVELDRAEASAMSDIEARADREAAEFLIPQDKLDSFIKRTKPLYYQAKVVQFAQARGVHPAIVVGQLQRQGELDYAQLRKLLVPVREHIVGQTITDGWGNVPRKAG